MNALAIAALVTFSSLTLGSNVRTAVGVPPPDVITSDVGQIWTWHATQAGVAVTTRAATDDDGIVQMTDLLARGAVAGPDVPAPAGTLGRLTFGKTRGSDADAIFGAPEFEGTGPFPDGGGQASFRGYRFASDREAVLLFDAGGGPLREMFYGRREALARAGLIPHEAPADVFKAASLLRLGGADFNKSKDAVAYSRIAIDADGSVASATIFISSGDADLDAVALLIDRGSTFVPATRNGAPIPSVYFRRENFIVAGTKT